MNTALLFALLFLALTVCVWTVLRVGLQGFGRYQEDFTEHTSDSFDQLFLFFDTRRVFALNLLLLILLPLVVWLLSRSLLYVLMAVGVVYALPKLALKFLETRRRAEIVAALPDALAQISGAMRAGATFLTAVETMVDESSGPLSQEFSLMLREQRMGKTLNDALDNVAERSASEEMDLVVTAAQISRELGGNLSDIFERLSHSLRRKIEMEGKIKALTSQGKMQGWVVGLLPFFIIAALCMIEPESMRPIFTSLLGWCFLAVILLMEIMGALMIRKIVSIDI